MNAIPRPRRLLCAAVSIAIAGVLFRSQLADALVTRGDDAFRNGDIPGSLRAYRRATLLDPHSVIAADRLAFFLAIRHDRADAQESIAVASDALARRADASLFADRAFAEMQLTRWLAAERDFESAGEIGNDARYDHFAGRMALKRGDRATARTDEERALAADPSFSPAQTLLRELE